MSFWRPSAFHPAVWSLGLQMCTTTPGFTWVVGIQTQILTLVWQPLGHLSSHSMQFSLFYLIICVYGSFACKYICVWRVPGIYKGQKQVLDLLDLELCHTCKWPCGCWNSNTVLWKSCQCSQPLACLSSPCILCLMCTWQTYFFTFCRLFLSPYPVVIGNTAFCKTKSKQNGKEWPEGRNTIPKGLDRTCLVSHSFWVPQRESPQ